MNRALWFFAGDVMSAAAAVTSQVNEFVPQGKLVKTAAASSNLAAGSSKNDSFLPSCLLGRKTCPQKVCRREGRKSFFYSSMSSLLSD